MNSGVLWILCSALAVCSLAAQEEQTPEAAKYVTRAASNSDFDLNGIRILCDHRTQVFRDTSAGEAIKTQGCPVDPVYVGEIMKVFGHKNNHTIRATSIEFPLPLAAGDISGSAVIDAAPVRNAPGTPQNSLLLRADGYLIQITGEAKITWTAPLRSLDDVKAGDWIDYTGQRNEAGVLIASRVEIRPDVIRHREEKRRTQSEFDPSAVPVSTRQNRLSAAYEGIDPKKFPPYDNPAMQVRVEEVGNKLVPPYQRALPDTDPAKIHFRFQLIDTKWFRSALPLASGIILVPRQVVERMQNDAQLAAILADGMASVMEKHAYSWSPAAGKMRLGGFLAEAAVSPALASLPALEGPGDQDDQEKSHEQSGRVSLALLHDAGYDIDQAPIAWWLLASANPKPIAAIALPDNAAYLYYMLGETWHNPNAHTTSSAKP